MERAPSVKTNLAFVLWLSQRFPHSARFHRGNKFSIFTLARSIRIPSLIRRSTTAFSKRQMALRCLCHPILESLVTRRQFSRRSTCLGTLNSSKTWIPLSIWVTNTNWEILHRSWTLSELSFVMPSMRVCIITAETLAHFWWPYCLMLQPVLSYSSSWRILDKLDSIPKCCSFHL